MRLIENFRRWRGKERGNNEKKQPPQRRPVLFIFVPTGQALLVKPQNQQVEGFSFTKVSPEDESHLTVEELVERVVGEREEDLPAPSLIKIFRQTPLECQEKGDCRQLRKFVKEVGGEELKQAFDDEMIKLVRGELAQIVTGEHPHYETIWPRED